MITTSLYSRNFWPFQKYLSHTQLDKSDKTASLTKTKKKLDNKFKVLIITFNSRIKSSNEIFFKIVLFYIYKILKSAVYNNSNCSV